MGQLFNRLRTKAILYNILGFIVEEIKINDQNNSYDIDITNKPTGTYLLKLTGGNEDHVSVFIVQ
ncbi:T9SS type A sorting domain-containing protein [uncultured Cytophaga sp.]|uniref:T9SS type A sorting domain-containing protein n=1 Tax=uncultured Cytophaga sp. TaxID=160238 RepID=UPI0034550F57